MPFTLEQINNSLQNTVVEDADRIALFSYQKLIAHFHELIPITVPNLIVGAHIVYGWMPRMLRLHPTNMQYDNIVGILNNLNDNNFIQLDDLGQIKNCINNSTVGASKLLHCFYPRDYAIWDTRVYRFINGNYNYNILRQPQSYLDFLENCRDVIEQDGFNTYHQSVNGILGYEVSEMRAIEWVMYMNGGN